MTYEYIPRQDMPTHHPETVYVQHNESRSPTSVRNITIPIVVAVTAAAMLIGLTYAGTREFSEIKHSITDLSRDVKSMGDSLSVRVNSIEREMVARTQDRWSRLDHELWCARTEQINPNWRCSPDSPLRTKRPVSGWRTRQQQPK